MTGRLVDFFDVKDWSETLIEELANPLISAGRREAARELVVQNYDLQNVTLPQLIDFVETAGGAA